MKNDSSNLGALGRTKPVDFQPEGEDHRAMAISTTDRQRLLRNSRVFGQAVELFEGDRDAASEWMFTPQPALGGKTPIDVATTELGSREVENGIYS